MIELAWFAAGAATVLVATRLLRRFPRRGGATLPPTAADETTRQRPVTPVPVPRPVPATAPAAPTDAHRIALSLAEELANLVSGVEGRAHCLIEAAPDRAALPAAAEGMLAAVQRLRTLHNKLVAFGQGRAASVGTTEVGDLVSSLTDELQQMQLGLELRWDPPPNLPRIAASSDIVHDALLFVCAALLRAERGATHLSIDAELCLASEDPWVQLELALEWVAEATTPRSDLAMDTAFALDCAAATNLIDSQGGQLSITHLPGRSVRALVRLPAALVDKAADAAAAPVPSTAKAGARDDGATSPHPYGGALVLEADPSVRAMLANELKATGRAVFACADGASAKSFLEATPDRFELLIVDHRQRLDAGDPLAQTIQALAPNLKICVLAQGSHDLADAGPRWHSIQKPFGVHELRQALATVLAG